MTPLGKAELETARLVQRLQGSFLDTYSLVVMAKDAG
jgi:hypothetical protein